MTKIPALCLFVSGAAALIDEVVWARVMVSLTGATTWAHAVTLASFMAGLSGGYIWGARTVRSSLCGARVYALAECVVALFAVGLPWGVPVLGDWLSSQGASHPFFRLGFAVALELVPAFAMGATLPAMVAIACASPDAVSRQVARLYAANNFGAVVGALLAGGWLIGALGLRISGCIAACASLAAAATCWMTRSSHGSLPIRERVRTCHQRSLWALGLAFWLGAAALVLQSAWLRMGGIVFGASAYSFAAVVAASIGGLALGAALASRWLGRGSGVARAVVQVSLGGGAVGIWVSLGAAPLVPYGLAWTKLMLPGTDWGFLTYLAVSGIAVAGLVAVAAAASGAALPAVIQAFAPPGEELSSAERRAGEVFGANAAGAVLGAALAPVLLPVLSLEGLIRASAVSYLCMGALAALLAPVDQARSWWLRRRRPAAVFLAAAAASAAVPLQWNPAVLSAGEFRRQRDELPSFGAWRRRASSVDVRYHRDGAAASVTVVGRGAALAMRINGKPDASNRGDMLTQVLSAHLPLLVHPAPRRVLVIGLGSGVTATSASLHEVHVEAVELSQEVVEAARLFDADHARPLDLLDVIVGDGRQVLSERCAQGVRYDVVISEPSNPWVAGNGALFTEEFFALVHRCLTSGGVLAQWFHLYETNDDLVLAVLHTVSRIFPHMTLWELHPNDILTIASKGPLPNPITRVSAAWSQPLIAADLARVHVKTIEGLLSREMIGPTRARRLAARSHAVHRDDRPFLETESPRSLFLDERSTVLRAEDERALPRDAQDIILAATGHPDDWSKEARENVFELDSRFPGAPPARRTDILQSLLADGRPDFLVDALFTLLGEGELSLAAEVARGLARRAPSLPRGLYATSLLVSRQPWRASEFGSRDALLHRCVELGDEPLGRCARSAEAASLD